LSNQSNIPEAVEKSNDHAFSTLVISVLVVFGVRFFCFGLYPDRLTIGNLEEIKIGIEDCGIVGKINIVWGRYHTVARDQ
jgi:hypothetical protein